MRVYYGIAGVTLIALSCTSPAMAAGCNGVVNPAVWGCAPWDNNNGPKYPNYKAPAPQNSAPRIVGGNNAPNATNNPAAGANRTTGAGWGVVAGGGGN